MAPQPAISAARVAKAPTIANCLPVNPKKRVDINLLSVGYFACVYLWTGFKATMTPPVHAREVRDDESVLPAEGGRRWQMPQRRSVRFVALTIPIPTRTWRQTLAATRLVPSTYHSALEPYLSTLQPDRQ